MFRVTAVVTILCLARPVLEVSRSFVCNPKCCLRNDYLGAQNLQQSDSELCYIELDGSVQIRD